MVGAIGQVPDARYQLRSGKQASVTGCAPGNFQPKTPLKQSNAERQPSATDRDRGSGGLEITGDTRRPARYGFGISKWKAQKDAQSASSIIVLCKVVI
jgi:hypothetical protein